MRVSSRCWLIVLARLAYGCAEAADGAQYAAVEPAVPAAGQPDGGSDASWAPRDDGGGDVSPEDLDARAGVAADTGATARDAWSDATTLDASVADAGGDAGDATIDAGCAAGEVALVAGSGAAASAVTLSGAAWSSVTSLAGSMKARPSVAATSTGFAAVSVAGDDSLQYSTRTAVAWSQLAAVGVGLKALDEARVVATAGAPRVVFQAKGGANDTRYFTAPWSAGAWGTPEAVGGGTDVSFGPRAPSVSTSGANLLLVHAGGNSLLYARERTATAWGASAQVGTVTVRNDLPTAVVELSTGGSLAVFSTDTGAAQKLAYTTRSGGTWTGSASVFDNGTNRAFSNDPLALLALSAGRALLVFRGGDTNLYATTFDPVGVVPWSPPTAITAQPVATASAPSLAAGICGSDAIVAFVDGATAKVARLTGTVWSAPEAVPGMGAATYVGVASKR